MRLIDLYTHKDRYVYTWGLLKERPTNANISHTGIMPSWDQHRRHVDSRPHPLWFFVLADVPDERIVGTIYLTARREVGIAIVAEEQRKGYAKAAIQLLRDLFPGPILANVAPGNEPSLRLFEGLGGRIKQITYQLQEQP